MKYPYTVTLTMPDGKRKYYRGKTKREAEAKRDKDKLLLGNGVNAADESTFQQVAESWYTLAKEDQLKAKSREIVLTVLTHHIYPKLGNKKVRSIKPADIFALMKSVSSYSFSMQKKVLQYTKAVFTFAMDNDMILKNPVISTIKPGGAKPEEEEALTDSHCAALLDAVRGTRAFLFVELLLYTGMRRGEALGLMWKDIDFAKAEMHVRRSVVFINGNQAGEINPDLKTSNARRDIPIVPRLLEDLRTAKAESKSLYVFSKADGNFLSHSSLESLWGIVRRRTKDLGFTVHPHQLRHTCITRWLENGMDLKEVQYLAGHSTADITMNIYAHYRKTQLLSETAVRMAACQL